MNKFLLKRPIISEKSILAQEANKYFFVVRNEANKMEIKKLIQTVYKVKVKAVNILKTHPKKKRVKGKEGTLGAYKKAMVTLQKGEKLDILPQ